MYCFIDEKRIFQSQIYNVHTHQLYTSKQYAKDMDARGNKSNMLKQAGGGGGGGGGGEVE